MRTCRRCHEQKDEPIYTYKVSVELLDGNMRGVIRSHEVDLHKACADIVRCERAVRRVCQKSTES